MEWRAENWRSGDVLKGWRQPLIAGHLSRPVQGELILVTRSVVTGEEREGVVFSSAGAAFTGLVRLFPGENEITTRDTFGVASSSQALDGEGESLENAMLEAALRMSLGEEAATLSPVGKEEHERTSQSVLKLVYDEIPRQEMEGSHHIRFLYVVPSDDPSGAFEGYDSACGRSPIEEASDRIRTMGVLLQAVVADRLRLHSFCPPASTFACLEDASTCGPEVIVHQCGLTRAQAEVMSDHALWGYFDREITRPPHCIDVVLMGMTRYDRVQRKPLAHTAMGGYPVALFGTGNMHLWPTSLSEVSAAALDGAPVPPELFFDDSGGRGSRWANFATGIGAVLHELLHSFGCMHVEPDRGSPILSRGEQPCMARGFDHINRVFMLEEPGMALPLPFHASEKMCFHTHTALRLRHSPFVNRDLPTRSDKGPGIKVLGDVLKAGSADGVVELSIVHLHKSEVVFTYAFTEVPMMLVTIPLDYIRRLDVLSDQTMFGCVAMDSTGCQSDKCSIFSLCRESSGDGESSFIPYGSEVSVCHVLSGRWLASQEVPLSHPGGSGYNVVNCMKTQLANRIQLGHGTVKPITWRIDRSAGQAELVRNGAMVELTHKATSQLLHSHSGIPSPMTSQQEVCCYPPGHLDDNNTWQVLSLSRPPTDRSPLKKGEPILLLHCHTRHYLHSHGGFEGRFTNYHQEVTAWPHKNDDNNAWTLHTC